MMETVLTYIPIKCLIGIYVSTEVRFNKISDRQVNKFNKLAERRDRGRGINAQSIVNNNQLQASCSNDKWVINLPNTPLTKAQESLLAKGPNYAIAPKKSP